MRWTKPWNESHFLRRFEVGQRVLCKVDRAAVEGEIVEEVQRPGPRMIEDVDFDGTPMVYPGQSRGVYRIRLATGELIVTHTEYIDTPEDHAARSAAD